MMFDKFQNLNAQRSNELFPKCKHWTGTDWATALAGEVGELCNLVKKMRRGDEIDVRLLQQELADVVIYCFLFASFVLDTWLSRIVFKKFNADSKRRDSKILIPENEFPDFEPPRDLSKDIEIEGLKKALSETDNENRRLRSKPAPLAVSPETLALVWYEKSSTEFKITTPWERLGDDMRKNYIARAAAILEDPRIKTAVTAPAPHDEKYIMNLEHSLLDARAEVESLKGRLNFRRRQVKIYKKFIRIIPNAFKHWRKRRHETR